MSSQIPARSITFSVVALIRRNDQRGDNSWQEICRVESRRNCINLSSLSRAGARLRRSVSIARLNLPSRRNRLRFALHYFHIISHPRNLPRSRRRSGPGHMAGCSHGGHRKTQRDSQWDSCYFHATFAFPAGITGISPCSSFGY